MRKTKAVLAVNAVMFVTELGSGILGHSGMFGASAIGVIAKARRQLA